MPRKYSVEEIGRMRVAIRLYIDSRLDSSGPAAEAMLQTYMQNGTSPDELEDWILSEMNKKLRADGVSEYVSLR